MNRTRIKICGLTRAVEVEWACQLGVDAIGLVFYSKSPRYVNADTASELSAAASAFVTVTGLFMDASGEDVDSVLQAVSLDLLQFHGRESAEYCESFGRPYIKAVPMGGTGIDVEYVNEYVAGHPRARGFLLDSNAAGQAGGSGETFDWSKIPPLGNKPVILAGGINAGNVASAVRIVQPYGVDVSSGVEITRGEKDHALMTHFVQEVRIVDQHIHR